MFSRDGKFIFAVGDNAGQTVFYRYVVSNIAAGNGRPKDTTFADGTTITGIALGADNNTLVLAGSSQFNSSTSTVQVYN